MITFTEKAANVVLNIMKEQEVSNDTLVRVGVKGGGCSGFTYTVDFDNQKGKFDLEFEDGYIEDNEVIHHGASFFWPDVEL